MAICKACLKNNNKILFELLLFSLIVKSKLRLPSPLLKFSSLWIQNLMEVLNIRISVMCQEISFLPTWGKSSNTDGSHIYPPRAWIYFSDYCFHSLDKQLCYPICFCKKRITLRFSLYSSLCFESRMLLLFLCLPFSCRYLITLWIVSMSESLHFLSGLVPLYPISICLISLDLPPWESPSVKVIIKTQGPLYSKCSKSFFEGKLNADERCHDHLFWVCIGKPVLKDHCFIKRL